MEILGHACVLVEASKVSLLTMIDCELCEKVIRDGTEKLFKEETISEERVITWAKMCTAWRKFVSIAIISPDEFLLDLNNIPAFTTTEVLQSFFTQLKPAQKSEP